MLFLKWFLTLKLAIPGLHGNVGWGRARPDTRRLTSWAWGAILGIALDGAALETQRVGKSDHGKVRGCVVYTTENWLLVISKAPYIPL